MSLTTIKDLLVAARAKLASITTTRDPTTTFKEHLTNTPFEDSPIAGADAFEIVSRNEGQAQGFGISGAREWELDMVVKLGHAPYETDDVREEWRVEDMERVVDLFESHTWPTGTMLVLHRADSDAVSKANPNWWISKLVFQVVLLGAVRTS